VVDQFKRYIDPNFFIPEDMPEEIWDHKPSNQIGQDGDFDVDVFENIDEGEDSVDDGPLTIDDVRVVSQKIRRAKDDSIVVDIVVEVDDIPGATKYEFRITKV